MIPVSAGDVKFRRLTKRVELDAKLPTSRVQPLIYNNVQWNVGVRWRAFEATNLAMPCGRHFGRPFETRDSIMQNPSDEMQINSTFVLDSRMFR